MDFYEELGVPRTASAEEIRRSYKRLARLFHPDYQNDPEMRAAAEIQMRRLNEILAVLTDPPQRMQYNLMFDGEPEDTGLHPRLSMLRAWLHPDLKSGLWFAAGAILVCAVAAVLAMDLRQPGWQERASNVSAPAAPAATLPDEAASLESRIDELRRRYPPEQHHQTDAAGNSAAESAADAPLVPAPVHAVRPALPQPPPVSVSAPPLAVSAPLSPRQTGARIPPAASPATTGPQAPPPAAKPETRPGPVSAGLPGLWRYTPASRPSTLPGVFAAERVEVAITEQSGVLYGYYIGRYAVPDSNVSPNVDFRFSGPPGAGATTLVWAGMNGNRGEINLRPLPDNALEVVWVTTHMEHTGNLASGRITLRRVGE